MSDSVLVCDPDPQTQRALQLILRGAGYDVLSAATGAEALDRVVAAHPRAVIVELALPDLDGIELCRRLRERDVAPVLVLSAIDDEGTKIEALGCGADDYVTKPFSPGELVARLGARVRSSQGAAAQTLFEDDGLMIDFAARRVTVAGEEVHLTRTEFSLLSLLAMSRGPVSHRALAMNVWGSLDDGLESEVISQRVRRHIAALRAKLQADVPRNVIRTEVGVGYRFGRLA